MRLCTSWPLCSEKAMRSLPVLMNSAMTTRTRLEMILPIVSSLSHESLAMCPFERARRSRYSTPARPDSVQAQRERTWTVNSNDFIAPSGERVFSRMVAGPDEENFTDTVRGNVRRSRVHAVLAGAMKS